MDKKRIDFWTTRIDQIVADYLKLNAACEAAGKAGALDPNGPLFDAIGGCLGACSNGRM